MKKKYGKPVLEICRFEVTDDVVTASGDSGSTNLGSGTDTEPL